MNLTLQNTTDGSQTVYSDTFKETYHSTNGAVTESIHVFIRAGFNMCKQNPVRIFEVGFGTGLNALLTLVEAQQQAISVEYHSIELFPIENEIFKKLAYTKLLNVTEKIFHDLHEAPWNETTTILDGFQLTKIKADLRDYPFSENFDLVYFDAFSPATQPDLWDGKVFRRLYESMINGAMLTTYCAKGEVRRTLQSTGFKVERLPGPPGKREMLRAIK